MAKLPPIQEVSACPHCGNDDEFIMKTDAKMKHHAKNPSHMKWEVVSERNGASGFGATPEDAYSAFVAAENESLAF